MYIPNSWIRWDKCLQPENRLLEWIQKKIEVTTDTTEIQRLMRDYYKQLYANEMDTLEEMDKFLERYKPPGRNK